ncbi:unnamed protein product [Phytophthora lilii]|uniref:Unnamed protein product n=1 Tax=Phytophthora lilii TaxID=2077276 RepID=A0A9W6UAZ3_9STRA|nr:unnamed protein product [Phytophthora lilii]
MLSERSLAAISATSSIQREALSARQPRKPRTNEDHVPVVRKPATVRECWCHGAGGRRLTGRSLEIRCDALSSLIDVISMNSEDGTHQPSTKQAYQPFYHQLLAYNICTLRYGWYQLMVESFSPVVSLSRRSQPSGCDSIEAVRTSSRSEKDNYYL